MNKEAMVVSIFLISFGIPFVVAPLVKALSQRLARGGQSSGSRDDARLAAIERNVDVIALEIEKLSESQRFLTKLLADREERAKVLPQEHSR